MISRLTSVSLAFVIASVFLATAGCSSNKSALEKRVVALQEELVAMQNMNDRLSERLTAIEMRQITSSAAPARSETATPTEIERPPLKVVKMGPGTKTPVAPEDPEAATENAEDDGPRPVIRDLGSGRKARLRASAGGLRQTELVKPASGVR